MVLYFTGTGNSRYLARRIAEAFYGIPPELQQETLKRLPEEMQETYELFRQNLERKMRHHRC